MSALALDDEQRNYVRRVREVAVDLLPLVEKGTEGRVNRPLLAAMGDHGSAARALRRDSPRSRRRTPRRCSCACSARPSRRSPPRPRPRSRCRAWAATRSCSPAARRRSSAGSLASSRGTTVAAFALTEPDAGSDAAALSLRADRDGDGWRLHGEKIWISNAPEADVYTVFARTTEGAGARGVTAFAVAGDADGLTGEHLDLLSPHPIGRLRFDGVRVGAGRRARRGRRRVPGRDAHAGPVPSQCRRLRRRHGAGGDRRHARPRVDPAGVRRPAGRPAVGGPHAGEPGDAARGRAPAGVRRGPRLRRRRASRRDHPVGRDGEALRHRGRPDRSSTSACSCTAPARSSAATCSSTSTATCAHRASTRARPRCSARSSPASCSRRGPHRDPIPGIRPADHELGALRLHGRGGRRHGHPEPAREAQPAHLRVVRRPARPARRAPHHPASRCW